MSTVRPARPLAIALAALLAISGAGTTLHASEAGAAARAAASPSPLRDHLVRKHDALQALKRQPAAPLALRADVTAESRSGVRRLLIRDYQFLSDSDRNFGGYDLGAGSWDTAVGVLASAVAEEFVVQAALAGIALDAVDVVFTSRPDSPEQRRAHRVAYPRNLGYVAYLDSPADDAQLERLRQAVERESAVLNLITEAQPIGHGQVVLTASPTERDPSLPPGLRDFLVEKRQAILRRQASGGSGGSRALQAHARVEPRSGLRDVRTGSRNFQFLHDSPLDQAGLGIAATVEEHQLGVLGTCLTHIFEIQAATRQVVLDSLAVNIEGTLSPRGGQAPRFSDVRYTVHIESPASRADIDALREAVEASCPVYNLLKDPQTIEGRVERGRHAVAAGTGDPD